LPAKPHASEFAGTSRYKVQRRLGAGAFGVVYEVEDALLGGSVALKVLHEPSGNALYRFKNEFRALADLKHENLVALHELTEHAGRWFFTMDLVQGVDIVKFLTGDTPAVDEATGEAPISSAVHGSAQDWDAMRVLFAQLARGVATLHDAAKIHRDIKPSNILVDTSSGAPRVVLLDFGLVTEAADVQLTGGALVGTPAYMAPEQAFAETVGPECDWYSIGSVLYVALTGRLPVWGKTSVEVLTRKQIEDPPPPSAIRSGVPPDLDELCMALLNRDPAKRPSGAEVLRRLGARPRGPVSGTRSATAARSPLFVGRARALATLSEAYRAMRDGHAVVVNVKGRSGFGKTELVRCFLEQTERTDPDLVALSGRCYERESVPYKALDALVDGLRRYIRRLPELDRNAILPRNMTALTRLFPVLSGVAEVQRRWPDNLRDTLEMRRRGFSALNELFARLADRQHVVLFIDDLQWGDFDSAAALAEILAPPDPPTLLLILAFRSEDMASSKLLHGLGNLTRGEHLRSFEIDLGPLADDEARELVTKLLAEKAEADTRPETVDQLVREGAGMPFMLGELVAFMNQGGGAAARATTGDRISASSLVDELVRTRAERLEADTKRLLEIICVAGQPLSRASALRAAGLSADRALASLDELRVAKLVRLRGTEEVETFHDRVCEAIIEAIPAATLVTRHDTLAEALEAEPDVDPERLGLHLRAAGHGARALVYLERAAKHASETLAFERAARLYRAALDLSEGSHDLRVRYAEALANAGHGGEAGRAYLAAIGDAEPAEVLPLRRNAAEQFLRSGHIDEALPVVEEVLREVGLKIPATPGRSLASLLVQRAKLWVRGLDFQEKRDVPAAELQKIDVCWALGNGMGGVDVIRGADFQARHLSLALRAGEPYRISRALAWESILTAIEGGPSGLRRAAEIVPRATAIAERLDNAHALAWATAAEAIRHFCLANWGKARTFSEASIKLFQEHCADIGWEVGSMEMWWWLPATRWLGDYAILCRHAPSTARDGSARGDRYTVTGVRTHVLPHVHLIGDRPDDASREGTEAIREWSQQRWLTHHWCNTVVQGHAALYSGRFGDGIACLERDGREMQRALQMRLQTMRAQYTDIRSRMYAAAALAEPAGSTRRRDLALLAERDADALEKESLTWARALGLATRAAAAKAQGNDDHARVLYTQAGVAFAELDMEGHELAARAQLGALEGGERGTAERASALAAFAARGVVNAERYARMLVP
jgi:hypothetical protein